MRNLIYISFTIFLCSCASPAKMFNSGLKKINKAIEKDSNLKLPNDTITISSITIQIDTVDNIITKTITNTVTNTVNECNYDEIKLRSARELRFAKKMYKLETKRMGDSLSYLKQENRQLTKQIKSNNSKEKVVERQKTKQEKGGWFTRIAGRYWWVILIIGFALGIYVRSLIQSIPNLFKKKQDEQANY